MVAVGGTVNRIDDNAQLSMTCRPGLLADHLESGSHEHSKCHLVSGEIQMILGRALARVPQTALSRDRLSDFLRAEAQGGEKVAGHVVTVAVFETNLSGNGRYRCRWIRR